MIHAIPDPSSGPVVHAQRLGRDGYVAPLCGSMEEPRTITNSSALVTCICCLMIEAKEGIMRASRLPLATHEKVLANVKQLAQEPIR